MSFVRCFRAGRRTAVAAAAMLFACGSLTYAEKPPVPSLRIPLESLGFPGYPIALLHAGASMATVHMLDDTHVLFTFSLRSLVPRLPGDTGGEAGRLVAGEVIELPSGKVLARTQWHLHDHRRYLWSAGQGLFVLRIGEELSLFAPLRGLANGTAFQRVALPHRPGIPQLIESSPDGRILTVQLQHPEEEPREQTGDDEQPRRKRTTIEFYRLAAEEAERPVQLKPAGAVGAPGFLRLAVDGDGYLWEEEDHHSLWAVSFNEFEGKPQSLATVHSGCPPTLRLLSRSEFAVLTCAAGGSPQLTVYGFDGHENWEEPFGQTQQAPTFAMAPAAGRFAMGRVYPTGSASGAENPLSQEVRVYQTESGTLLLHLQCDPVARTAENFDLSADGRTLAMLGSKALELYTLPPLSASDRKDLAEVEGMRPPESHGPVVLRRITRPIHEGSPETEEEVHEEGESAIPDAVHPPTAAASGTSRGVAAGQAASAGEAEGTAPSRNRRGSAAVDAGAESEAPRKPPTLLSPGESPQFKPPDSAPQ